MEGSASFTWSPRSSTRALTLPQAAPATTGSPTRRVPLSHDDRGHRAPARLQVGLEHGAPGPALGAGPQLLHLGHQR